MVPTMCDAVMHNHSCCGGGLQAQSMLQRQWDGLVQAPDGSIKNRFYR